MFTGDSSFEVSFGESTKKCCLFKLVQHLVATQDKSTIPCVLTSLSTLSYQTSSMFRDTKLG